MCKCVDLCVSDNYKQQQSITLPEVRQLGQGKLIACLAPQQFCWCMWAGGIFSLSIATSYSFSTQVEAILRIMNL